MANPRLVVYLLLGLCLSLLVSCQAEYPPHDYEEYYPYKYYPYPTYDYEYYPTHNYPVLPFRSYPVYYADDDHSHKAFHYDPHADYDTHPYNEWGFEDVKHLHYQPYIHDHDGYGYHADTPDYRSAPYLNLYNKFDGGRAKQHAESKADASSSTAGSAQPNVAESSLSGSSSSREGSSSAESQSSQQSSAEAVALPTAARKEPSRASSRPRPTEAPMSSRAMRPRPSAAATLALPASMADAPRDAISGKGPQSDSGWNFVAADSSGGARWYPRSGYSHIDQVRSTEAPKT